MRGVIVSCGWCTCLLIPLPILTHLRSLAEMAAATSVHVVAIVEPIIQHADWFFPEGKPWVSFSVFHRLVNTQAVILPQIRAG